MPSTAPTPEQIFHRVVDGVSRLMAGDVTRVELLTQLYAQPTHVVHPLLHGYAPLTSHADMRRHFAEAAQRAGQFSFRAEAIRIHRTTDPEVIIAEFTYCGTGSAAPLAAHCIFVWRVRDGLIVEARDYIDYAAFARAAGRSTA